MDVPDKKKTEAEVKNSFRGRVQEKEGNKTYRRKKKQNTCIYKEKERTCSKRKIFILHWHKEAESKNTPNKKRKKKHIMKVRERT